VAPLREAEEFIRANQLQREVELLPPTHDARQAYWESDAVLLASYSEGCPNVVCEAMACARPVLASAVSDIPLIVENGVSGLLFDPTSPDAIAKAIAELAVLSPKRRRDMGNAGRRRAEALFDLESCCQLYETLLHEAAVARRRSISSRRHVTAGDGKLQEMAHSSRESAIGTGLRAVYRWFSR